MPACTKSNSRDDKATIFGRLVFTWDGDYSGISNLHLMMEVRPNKKHVLRFVYQLQCPWCLVYEIERQGYEKAIGI